MILPGGIGLAVANLPTARAYDTDLADPTQTLDSQSGVSDDQSGVSDLDGGSDGTPVVEAEAGSPLADLQRVSGGAEEGSAGVGDVGGDPTGDVPNLAPPGRQLLAAAEEQEPPAADDDLLHQTPTGHARGDEAGTRPPVLVAEAVAENVATDALGAAIGAPPTAVARTPEARYPTAGLHTAEPELFAAITGLDETKASAAVTAAAELAGMLQQPVDQAATDARSAHNHMAAYLSKDPAAQSAAHAAKFGSDAVFTLRDSAAAFAGAVALGFDAQVAKDLTPQSALAAAAATTAITNATVLLSQGRLQEADDLAADAAAGFAEATRLAAEATSSARGRQAEHTRGFHATVIDGAAAARDAAEFLENATAAAARAAPGNPSAQRAVLEARASAELARANLPARHQR